MKIEKKKILEANEIVSCIKFAIMITYILKL